MKKKNLALILTAVLAMSGTGQALAVSAADFSDGESFGEEVRQMENPEAELFEEPEISGDIFSAEAAELFADGEKLPAAAVTTQAAPVAGWSVTKEAFEAWRSGDGMDVGDAEPTDGTTADIFGKVSHATGYIAIGFVDGQEGFADLVIPEGLNVAVLNWCEPALNSLTPGGEVIIRSGVRTPGTLEIREGKGSVTFRESSVQGMLYGAGSNDTVRFEEWNWICGMKGVENTIFANRDEGQSLEVADGTVEFHHIYQENADGKNVNINIQGYGADKIPVFYNDFDLGSMQRSDEEGNTWTDPGSIGVCYIENFEMPEGQDWKAILPKQGAQFVSFKASDADIADMLGKMYLAWDLGEKRAAVEFDGTIFYGENDEAFYQVQRIKDSEGVSAAEAFERYARAEFPDSCFEWFGNYGTVKTMEKVMNAEGSGYYKVDLPKVQAFDRLTVPEKAKGVIYQMRTIYDEAADMETYCNANVKFIDTPAGKTMKINSYKAPTGTLTISGSGDTQFFGSRINQNVNAEGTVTMQWSTVKSLKCDTLHMKESWLMVEEELKFNQASILNSDIFAKAGASLRLGAIDNTGTQLGDMALNLEVKNGIAPEVYFAKAFRLGDVVYEEEEPHDAGIDMSFYDYARMASVGSNTVKDMYSESFDVWNEDEEKNYYSSLMEFKNKEEALVTFSKEAIENAQYVMEHFHIRCKGKSLFIEAGEVTDTKAQFYSYAYETEEISKTNSYIAIGVPAETIHLSGGSIAAIRNQYYTGKALTPAVTVTVGGRTLKKNTDYTAAYENNTKAGTASVTVTGIGAYRGTLTKTFKIVYNIPKKGSKHAIGSLKYKVTKAASSGGTVMVYAPVKTTYTSLTIPSAVKINGLTFKVTTIYTKAFRNNKKLKAVTIGKYIDTIGSYAFYGDSSLKTIKFAGTGLKSAGKDIFKGIYKKAVIKVPSAKLKAYTKLLKGKGQASTVKITK